MSDDFVTRGMDILRDHGFPVAGIHDQRPQPSGDLAEFLRARIAEDEAEARKVPQRNWSRGDELFGVSVMTVSNCDPVAYNVQTQEADHIARWDPARVLAECEAKRRIVEMHTSEETPTICPVCHYQGGWEALPELLPCLTLRLLALPYADHPDFREEWRP